MTSFLKRIQGKIYFLFASGKFHFFHFKISACSWILGLHCKWQMTNNNASTDHLSLWKGFWHHSSRITVCIFTVVCLQIFYFHDVHKLWTFTLWILKVTSLWASHPYCHSETLQTWSLPSPTLPLYTSVTVMHYWREDSETIKPIYEWKWTQSLDYRSTTHPGIK